MPDLAKYDKVIAYFSQLHHWLVIGRLYFSLILLLLLLYILFNFSVSKAH